MVVLTRTVAVRKKMDERSAYHFRLVRVGGMAKLRATLHRLLLLLLGTLQRDHEHIAGRLLASERALGIGPAR